MKTFNYISALFLCFAVSGCAVHKQKNPSLTDKATSAVTSPLHDLNIVREEIPPILEKAEQSKLLPKNHEGVPLDCKSIDAELTGLSEVLGPIPGEDIPSLASEG